jgi:hypothetical protein
MGRSRPRAARSSSFSRASPYTAAASARCSGVSLFMTGAVGVFSVAALAGGVTGSARVTGSSLAFCPPHVLRLQISPRSPRSAHNGCWQQTVAQPKPASSRRTSPDHAASAQRHRPSAFDHAVSPLPPPSRRPTHRSSQRRSACHLPPPTVSAPSQTASRPAGSLRGCGTAMTVRRRSACDRRRHRTSRSRCRRRRSCALPGCASCAGARWCRRRHAGAAVVARAGPIRLNS